jgi:hypothetical protein
LTSLKLSDKNKEKEKKEALMKAIAVICVVVAILSLAVGIYSRLTLSSLPKLVFYLP